MRHGNTKREKWHRLAERCEVEGFVAPQRIKEIARERTEGLVHYLVLGGFMTNIDYVHRLAESAYMQGMNDILDVVSGKYGDIAKLASGEHQ